LVFSPQALVTNTVASGTNTKLTYNALGQVTAGAAATLASADFANQGATTQVLHGNASGNPSWSAIAAADLAAAAYRATLGGYCTGAAGTSQVIAVSSLGATAIACSQSTAPGAAGYLAAGAWTVKNLYINEGT